MSALGGQHLRLENIIYLRLYEGLSYAQRKQLRCTCQMEPSVIAWNRIAPASA